MKNLQTLANELASSKMTILVANDQLNIIGGCGGYGGGGNGGGGSHKNKSNKGGGGHGGGSKKNKSGKGGGWPIGCIQRIYCQELTNSRMGSRRQEKG